MSNATLTASIAAIDSEIARLTDAREALVTLVDSDGDTPKRTKQDGGRTRTKRTNKSTTAKRTAKRSGNGSDGLTRKEQIISLLDQEMTPREIADELGIAPNYVYHVKRGL